MDWFWEDGEANLPVIPLPCVPSPEAFGSAQCHCERSEAIPPNYLRLLRVCAPRNDNRKIRHPLPIPAYLQVPILLYCTDPLNFGDRSR